jgi:hypothetical protein
MIKIALLLTLASLTGLNAPAALLVGSNLEEPPSSRIVTEVAIEKAKATQEDKVQVNFVPKSEEEIVKAYFQDIPLLVKVAQCESNFRHTYNNGEILRGVANSQDIGIMQINERFHLERANKLDLDIYTIDGNLEYARFLYGKEGAKPWSASRKCWSSREA